MTQPIETPTWTLGDVSAAAAPATAPPEAPSPTAARWRLPAATAGAVLVVAAWVVLELWGLGAAPFHTKGEPREGLVVWEMTHGGGWILPRRNGVELPSKPPLFHWLGAAASLLHGATDEWSIRLPSAGLSLLTLLGVFAAGTALWSVRAGVCSALVLMTTFEWARAATNARVDMTLTFGLTAAFLSLLFFLRSARSGWLVPLYLGIAWAVLGKGPVGVALPGLTALVMIALGRDVGVLRRLRLVRGALAVAVLAGTWYVLALAFGGWAFFHKQVLAENVFTFLDNPQFGGGHRHPASYLLGALLVGLLPWTPFLAGTAARLWRQRRELTARDPRVYLLAWIIVVFGFYALAASKRSVYLLALYPAVALLLGWWWDEQRRAPSDAWLARLLPVIAWPLFTVAVLVAVAVTVETLGVPLLAAGRHWLPPAAQPFLPWVSETMRGAPWALLGTLLIAATALLWLARRAAGARWFGIFTGVLVTVAALLVGTQQVVMPGIARRQSLRSFMSDVRAVVGPAGEVSFYKTFEYGAVYYWHGHIPTYDGPWPAGAPDYLLVEQAEWERLEAQAHGVYAQVLFPADDNDAENGRLVLIRRVGKQ